MIYCSIHCDHRQGDATIKLWPTYPHARTDIHTWGNKLENKGWKVKAKDVIDRRLHKLVMVPGESILGKSQRARVLSVHEVPAAIYDDRLKLYQLPEWVAYNTFTHQLECLGTYTDARVHLTNYAIATKEFSDYNWHTPEDHKIFKQAYDDLEKVHNEEADSFSVELEKGSVIFFRIAKHNMLGTVVRREFLPAWRGRNSLPNFITHDMV